MKSLEEQGEELYETTLERGKRVVDLVSGVEKMNINKEEWYFIEVGISAGIAALLGELKERGLIAVE